LISPRYGTFTELEVFGLQFQSKFKAQGLEDFIDNNIDYYLYLVKVFYYNLEIKNGVIIS